MTSRHIHLAFKTTGPRFRAEFLRLEAFSIDDEQPLDAWWRQKLKTWLARGICNFEVLQLLINETVPPKSADPPEDWNSFCSVDLPKHILRSFSSNDPQDESQRKQEADAMAFLRYLLDPFELPTCSCRHYSQACTHCVIKVSANPDSHQGYSLARAVHLDHQPLVELLLGYGANPSTKSGVAIKFAISKRFICHRGSIDLEIFH